MAVQNSLTQQKQKATFSAFLTSDAVKTKVNQIIGGKDGQRFMTAILSAVSTNPVLAECENGSILSCALLGETLKLSPSPQLGQYYLVPYNDKNKGKVATFQLGYKGYIQLAIRSGYYKKINVLAIKEGELIKYNPLDEEIEVNLIDDEVERENKPDIGYYAMFEYSNGFKKAMYWSKAKMEKHADTFSQAFKLDKYKLLQEGKIPKDELWKYSSFWYKDFTQMAYKTMLRQLISKWGIMSIELQTAIDKDMAFIDENGKANYVDNDMSDPIENKDTIEISPDGEVTTTADSNADVFFNGTE